MAETPATTTAPATIETFAGLLRTRAGAISAVAAKHLSPERLGKVAIAAIQRNPKLLQCTPESLFRAIFQAVELGFEPGSALNHVYLVPYYNKMTKSQECQLQVGYQGMADLAFRSGHVTAITAEVVYRNDVFEFELGLDPKLRHIPGDHDERDEDITHAYCVVSLKSGAKVYRVLTRRELMRLMEMNAQFIYNKEMPDIWKKHFAEMCRVKAVKKTLKLVPKSIEIAKTERLDDYNDTRDGSLLSGTFEIPEALALEAEPIIAPETATQKLKNKVANPGPVEDQALPLADEGAVDVEGGTERGR